MFDPTISAIAESNVHPMEGNNEAIATSRFAEIDTVSTQLLGSQLDDSYVRQTVEVWESSVQSLQETHQTLPDLIVSDINAPTTIKAGTSVSVEYTLTNQGEASVGYWDSSYTYFYLSTDTTLDDGDTYLDYDYYRSGLAAGESRNESQYISFEQSLAPGNYYLFASIAVASFNLNPSLDSYSIKSGYGLINAAAAVAEAINQEPFADVPDLGGDSWGADLVKAPEVWNAGYTGEGVVVAVLDTGVDRNHNDLKDNIWKNTGEIAGNGIDDDENGFVDDVYGWNFASDHNDTLDVHSHGTHVAGTIAGIKNDFGVTGIAYDAQIMPVKVLGDDGSGSYEGVAQGIRYAADNGADVINMSLGGSYDSDAVRLAVEYAANKGVIVVSAAGNDSDTTTMGHYPAAYATEWGLAVGAVDDNNNMAYFSNHVGETKLSYITAPGVDVLSTTPNNSYDSYSGTSMAAPHVAGVIALMLEANPYLTDAQVRQIVAATAENSQFIA
ncbi:MAG: S8 family serine peptidase [Crocosphaera sp.]|nr:S8 family serine peptidase [Crocosphaera sp.]